MYNKIALVAVGWGDIFPDYYPNGRPYRDSAIKRLIKMHRRFYCICLCRQKKHHCFRLAGRDAGRSIRWSVNRPSICLHRRQHQVKTIGSFRDKKLLNCTFNGLCGSSEDYLASFHAESLWWKSTASYIYNAGLHGY